ncbi:Gfo/Idh/MocA family protein [Dyadobacter sp. NIV53]|uniref:Gfo/Idh/MocA family protein n=1 Tax=Dyadobacter sp. NIV53 TaxID=2861765 RepID=UPI001C86EBE6|nr:Gfo/Idh/MocA family oxidoreductase [Dyadobacter sp. NIV53]
MKINVAIVGLGFGAEFIPIYQKHPDTSMYAVCQRNEQKLKEVADAYGIDVRYSSFEQLLEDPIVDAVHINSPIPNHAEQSIKALRAGKHVACTVPMATSVEDCLEIVRATKETGKKYMMMETVVYSREFLFVKELYEKGELGKVQFLKASHQQDMEGWPDYWPGLPPMHYATHCVGPVAGLLRLEAEYVSCFGSGTISPELASIHNSPFAVESAHIKFKNSDLAAYVYRSLFDVARQYRESFEVYGSKKSFEWPLIEGEKAVIHTAKKPEAEIAEKVRVPDFAHYLPDEIASFTMQGVYNEGEQQHLSFVQGSGHGGSHPHMVHEFVTAIVQGRDPFPNAVQSANWTSVGILAHQSAMKGGKLMQIPDFGEL